MTSIAETFVEKSEGYKRTDRDPLYISIRCLRSAPYLTVIDEEGDKNTHVPTIKQVCLGELFNGNSIAFVCFNAESFYSFNLTKKALLCMYCFHYEGQL